MKNHRILYIFLGFFALNGSLLAATSHQYRPPGFAAGKARNHFEVIGAVGASALDANNSSLSVTSTETDKLVPTNNNDWRLLATQLGAGYIINSPRALNYSDRVQWFTSVEPELNIYRLANNNIQGNVLRFGSSSFNDANFTVPVSSTRVMLDAALTIAKRKRWSLYAIGGIGNAWNRISYSDQFNSNATCPEQIVSLKSNSNSNFAWELGLGVLYAFNDHIGLSLQYLYTDLGKVQTSATSSTGSLPVLAPVKFNLNAQTGLLGLHIALSK